MRSLLLLLILFTSALGSAREFETDRPSRTESPYTVERGRFQIETSLVEWYDDEEKFHWNVMNLKFGLSGKIDIETIVESYIDQKNESDPDGFGDTTIRAKFNLQGNDGGQVAVALMPFLKLPTAKEGISESDELEGGLIVPLSIALDTKWDFGYMAEFDYSQDQSDNKHHLVFISSFVLARNLSEPFLSYLELYSESVARKGAQWVATANLGIAYDVAENVRLDLGADFGLTDAAERFRPFIGASVLF